MMLKRLLAAITAAASLALAAGAAGAEMNASADLQALFDAEFAFRLRENPRFATDIGDHRFDDRLGGASPADYARRLEEQRRFLERLRAIDRSALTQPEQVSYDIFARLKEDRIHEYGFQSYLMPITNRSGFHVGFPRLPGDVPLDSVEDYENYISRLNDFGRYTDEHIELMRLGIRKGIVTSRIGLEGYDGAIAPHIVDDPMESLLFAPFDGFPEAIGIEERGRLIDAGKAAILDVVVPSYQRLLTFLDDEYFPAAREEIDASSLPNGRAFYEHRVRRYTSLDVAPQEVHDRGLAEVARIRSEMQTIVDELEYDGSFADFLEFMRTDDRFYVDTPEALMRHVAYVLKRMDGKLPELFGRLPRMPYGIERVPDYIAPRTTTAYYDGPSGDGSKAGTYFVNTYDLGSRPLYEVEALSLHEAVPGHHLQIALQQEMEYLPAFRRYSGFTAFVEGWALYAERLGLEVGFYEDPYSNFGRLTYEMWRATRLVVDTGIHYFDWTRQQAIDYMAENTALTLHNITTEVGRYITWPGQALAYKTGELKIRELRLRAETVLGNRFDLRAFHDVVLGSGAVPLSVLEQNVEAFIAANDG